MNTSPSYSSLIRLTTATLGLSAWAFWSWFVLEKPLPVPEIVISIPIPVEPPAKVVETSAPPLPAIAQVLPPDRVLMERAEADLDAVSRDRARAEARASDADRALQAALAKTRVASTSVKTLAYKVRDPSTRIAQASSRGGFLKAERDKLEGEVAAIASAPRPKPNSIISKSPVARPTRGKEYHFEIRRDRVTTIDLERMLELIKLDAKVKMRLSSGRNGVIASKIGPVGAFSLNYELQRSGGGLEDLLDSRGGGTYDLAGWELIPERENRGETLEIAHQPTSEYTRSIHRLSPSSATITMWVYPDGFKLYRALRDELHSLGFTVAARPMPETMTIRGSPSGSHSAGQ